MLCSWQRHLPWRHRRTPISLSRMLFCFLAILAIYSFARTHSRSDDSKVKDVQLSPAHNPLIEQHAAFWRSLYELLLNHDPECEALPERVVPQRLDIEYDPDHQHPRADVLWMETADIRRMQRAHAGFVDIISSTTLELVYNPGTRGLVMTAGLGQLPVAVISIRMLRRTGSSLPVEVFLGTRSDYDIQVCEAILPDLNAKCLVFSDIIQFSKFGVVIDKFQYKIMSVIFSSFEDVLLLDSDAFPVHDPEILFHNEPFGSSGLLLWPDFWYASESPYFFQISQLGRPPPLSEQPSTESGEIFYSKPKHKLSLFLAAYYNYYGPPYYYLLQSQGAPGQGDKETFGWAAKVMNETFYFVREPVMALGRLDSSGEYYGSAMAQHSPLQDYQRTINQTTHNDHPIHYGKPQSKGVPQSNNIAHNVQPFFVHANFPKFDPATIFFSDPNPTQDSNGTKVRCWLDERRVVELFGFDLERQFWEEIMHTACEYENVFTCWRGKTGICNRVRKHWEAVFATKS